MKFANSVEIKITKCHSNGMYTVALMDGNNSVVSLTGPKSQIEQVRDMLIVAHRFGYIGMELTIQPETLKKEGACNT